MTTVNLRRPAKRSSKPSSYFFMVDAEVTGTWTRGLAVVQQMKKKPLLRAHMEAGLRVVSTVSAAALRKMILSGSFPAAYGTLVKRAVGKLKGAKWDPIKTYPGNIGLSRSGQLAEAITSQRLTFNRYIVGVEEGVVGDFSGGKPAELATIACLLEDGWTINVPVTARMQAYLHILFGGKRAAPKHHIADVYMGYRMLVNVKGKHMFLRTWNGPIAIHALEWFEQGWSTVAPWDR